MFLYFGAAAGKVPHRARTKPLAYISAEENFGRKPNALSRVLFSYKLLDLTTVALARIPERVEV